MTNNLSQSVKDKIKSTGKPYGGIIKDARFYSIDGQEFEGRTTFEFCTGDLENDPRHRFGKLGNFGMRTSYIVKKGKNWLETRNTIYEYELRGHDDVRV